MKKAIVPGVCLIFACAIVGGLAWGGIEGSKHDFSNQAWSAADTCGACHSPHRKEPPKAAPLWEPDADLTRRFGTSFDAAASTKRRRSGLGRGTLMCSRCHDGTIATETITGVKGDRFTNKLNPGLFLTGHGGSDHPVGVDYPQLNKGFRPITSVVASGTVVLPNARVECTSCHDPHNLSGVDPMLVTSNARSALCLTCHKK